MSQARGVAAGRGPLPQRRGAAPRVPRATEEPAGSGGNTETERPPGVERDFYTDDILSSVPFVYVVSGFLGIWTRSFLRSV